MQTQPYPGGGQGPAQQQILSAASSLLVADCGSVVTKVSLLGLVEGQYRLMARGEAPTTHKPPYEDVTEGIIQAVQIIEFITGRRFFEKKQVISPERSNGDGVDLFIATVSAGEPLRLIVMGAVSPMLEDLAEQAISGLYVQAQTVPSPSFVAVTSQHASAGAGTSAGGTWTADRMSQEWERQLSRIRELHPQAALIVGMIDTPAGAAPLQEACQLLVNAAREHSAQSKQSGDTSTHGNVFEPYSVVYAAAPQYVEAVRRMVQEVAEVTRVDSLVSPTQLGPVSMTMGELHEHYVMKNLPGYERLGTWSSTAPMASATSLSSLIRFLAQHYAMNVTAVDVGGANTTVMVAGEHGEFIPMVNAGIGVGSRINGIFQRVGWQRIARWVPFRVTEEEIRQFVVSQMAHPQAVPAESRQLQISQAFAREAIALTVETLSGTHVEWPKSDLILATGSILSHAPKYGQVAMILLDALQPCGVTSLVLDKTMLISQLGAVATVAPIAAVQVNENDAVSHRLGTCVVPFGNMKPGEVAVSIGLEYANGRQVNMDVMAGSIEVLPLRPNEQALLTLFPAPTVDVGLGPGERARAAEEIDGGLIGLIIDARGRPLHLPADETERQARLLQWIQALGA
jgi:MutL-like protein